jgi:tetratricopeptide (TPR) repeat protein
MPTTTIVGDPNGIRGDVYDVYELFDRADKAFAHANWPAAIRFYSKILEEYGDSDVAPLARYNLGLTFENTGQWEQALAAYQGFALPPGQGVRTEEVRLRRGICLQRLGRLPEAKAEFAKILDQLGVPPLEFNEARMRLGIVLFYLGDAIFAEHYLGQSLPEYQRNAKRGVIYARAAYAEACFVMGEIRFRRFESIALAGEASALAMALQEKAEALLEAREFYTNAVRTYEPTWVTASLYKVGLGFELFFRAVLAVPYPADLAAGDRPAYRREVIEKVRPLLENALIAYRRNLEIAADLHVENEWIQMTRAHYEQASRITQEEPQ